MITRYILHDLQEDHNLQLQFADSIRELAKKNSDAEVVNIIIDSHSGAEHDFYDDPDPDRLRRQKMELSLRRVLSEDQYVHDQKESIPSAPGEGFSALCPRQFPPSSPKEHIRDALKWGSSLSDL